jgi:hypothetical protein
MSITNVDDLAHAINEAKRFIKIAKTVQAIEPRIYHHMDASPKDTGATRRASMDLTRALAELRKP